MPKLSQLTDYNEEQPAVDELPVENPYRRIPVFKSDPVEEEKPSIISNLMYRITNKLLRDDDQRYQLWPEKVIREALTGAGDVASGKVPTMAIDPATGDVHTSPQMIEKAQAISALAGTGGLGGVTDATLGATPFLRPALKYKDRLYKGKEGQQHMDVIPEALYPEFQKMAMSGEDISHYNFGFVNDKGHFLDREKALKYAVDTGMVDKFAGQYGALTSTLLADSSKPGMAIEAMAKANPFFSAVEHSLSKIPQSKMLAEEWLGPRTERKYIDNSKESKTFGKEITEVKYGGKLGNATGVKPEELEWTGLADFLNANKGKPITKAQIEEHLAANKVELKEVSKGKAKEWEELTSDEKAKVEKRYTARYGDDPNYHPDFNVKDFYKNNYQALEAAGATKYHGYQLPGGENYREMLLTLPTKSNSTADMLTLFPSILSEIKTPKDVALARQHNVNFRESFKGIEDKDILDNITLASKLSKTSDYKSSHWDEPNILAHVRMNDRTIDGKKSLHLEEIQSDWHQQGRDKGYATKEKIDLTPLMDAQDATRKAYSKAIEDSWLKHSNGKASNYREARDLLPNDVAIIKSEVEKFQLHDKEFNKIQDAATKASQDYYAAETKSRSGVPDAPFKKNWHELALKRMIREAAEKGYDRLSWTPGEAQAARYDLSKTIDHLSYNPETKSLLGHKENSQIVNQKVEPDKLSDFVGKEAAKKLLDTKLNAAGYHDLKNADLKIGGEGMKGFYDQIIPKALEKLGKEHGVKVKQDFIKEGEVKQNVNNKWIITSKQGSYNTKAEAEAASKHIIHYIDIPQSLKDTALHKGFPLFSKGGFMFTPVDHEPEFK